MIILKKEELENTYQCSVCGEMHPNSSMCPVMKEKIKKTYSKKYTSYFWLNVMSLCLSQGKSFSNIINEVSYLENHYNFWNKKFDRTLEVFIEDIVSYVSYELDCTPKQLFQPTDLEAFLNILNEKFDYTFEIIPEDVFNESNKKIKYVFLYEHRNRSDFIGLFKKRECNLSENENLTFRIYKYAESANKCFYEIDAQLVYPTSIDLITKHFNPIPFSKTYTTWDNMNLYAEKKGVLANYTESLINTFWDCFSTEYNYLETDKYNDLIFYDFLRAAQVQNIYVKKRIRSNDYFVETPIICYNGEFKGTNNNSYCIYRFSLKIYDKNNPNRVYRDNYEEIYKNGGKLYDNCLIFLDIKTPDTERENISIYETVDDEKKLLTNIVEDLEKCIKQNEEILQNLSTPQNKKCLDFKDIIIKSNFFSCVKRGHTLQPYTGLIPVLKFDENNVPYEDYEEAYIGYCSKCNKYYMFNDVFEEISKNNKILCTVIEESKVLSPNFDFSNYTYKSQSILNALGYSVGRQANLSEDDRHSILQTAIDDNIVKKYDVIEYLRWLIRTRTPLANQKTAIAKWKNDLNFVEDYKRDENKYLIVKSIKK